MGSKHKQSRQLQKERYEELLAKRKAFLAEKGIKQQKQAKDKVVKHLQAKINQIARAIVSIKDMETAIEKATLEKQKSAEKKKADKSKPKKKKPESDPEKEDKKEKKEKKEKKSDKQ